MNILMMGILVLCAICMIYGYMKGFIRIVISLVAVWATVVLVGMFVPTVTELIVDYTPLDEAIELQFSTAMFGDDVYIAVEGEVEELPLSEQITLIETAEIPDYLKEAALVNNNNEIYEQLGVSSFTDYIGKYLASWMIKVLAYIVTFLLVWCVVSLVVFSLDVIANLPVLHGINRVIGTFLGLGFAVVIIWLGFLTLSIMYSTEIGQMCYGWIEESKLLMYLYEHNLILNMLLN